MKKIEFIKGINGTSTKIFVDGTQLETFFDDKAIKQYCSNRSKLPPIMGTQILEITAKKLENDKVNLTLVESKFILDYLKKELGL